MLHDAILKNEEAFDTVVDAVHKLMELEDWDNARTLNEIRGDALHPLKELDAYDRALDFMKDFPCLKEYYDKLFTLIENQ